TALCVTLRLPAPVARLVRSLSSARRLLEVHHVTTLTGSLSPAFDYESVPMYVIFRALGKQFRAEKGQTVRVPLMDAEPGSKVTFDEVLLSSDGETINAGTPLVKGAKV